MQNHPLIRGFSLIELMIVVAIVGILSVIAIPTYQNYTKRARFTEVMIASEPFKVAVTLALQSGAAIADLNTGSHGIPTSPHATKNLEKIEVVNGTIIATATELANHATYVLAPDTDGDGWSVSGTCVQEGFCEA